MSELPPQFTEPETPDLAVETEPELPTILVVDDLREFTDGGEKLFGTDAATSHIEYAKTSVDAIARLEEPPMPKLVLLDHDLGADDRAVTVVDYLSELAAEEKDRPEQIIVHTSNSVGGDTMIKQLERWGYDVTRINPTEYSLIGQAE